MRGLVRSIIVCFLVGLALVPVGASGAGDDPSNHPSKRSSETGKAVPVTGKWVLFGFGERGTSTGPFTFRSRGTVLLRVTDIACRGDRFAVFQGSTHIGRTTRVPVDEGCDQKPNIFRPKAAFDSATFSHGAFLLPPGDHRIRIRVTGSPFGGGGAYLSASRCSIVGTRFGEWLKGSAARDFVCARAGSDTIPTWSGPDLVYAGRGDDTVRTWSGQDTAEGEAGRDMLIGGTGGDRVVGGAGSDAVIGAGGADVVIGGDGVDLVLGWKGKDTLDAVDGVGGNDLVVGGPGADLCRADTGDHLRGCEEVRLLLRPE